MQRSKQWFFICGCALSIIGIIFIYSAGSYWSTVHYDGQIQFYSKQLVYLVLAIVLFGIVLQMPLIGANRFWLVAYFFTIALLIAVLIPGIGIVRNGSRSWIGLGPLTVQPAELVKITTLLYLSILLSKRKAQQGVVRLSHFIVILLPSMLIMMQPDFGAVFILIVSACALLFIANYPLKLFVLTIVSGIAALIVLIVSAPYRLKRIEAFLNPWEDALGSGFQAVQSLLAIGPAGLFGQGFLKSRQKYLYLPEPQNDFIFAIILEEIGLIGGGVVLLVFVCFLYSGFMLAKYSIQAKNFYVISALTTMLAVQACLNIGVVVGLLPVTGVTLPFISYGGTSLVIVWLTMAVILHHAQGVTRKEE